MNTLRHVALNAAISAVCPIYGVSVTWADKSKWRINFKPEATTEERAAAQGVVDAFDPTAPVPAEIRDAADETERTECRNDSSIIALVNQTKAEWQAWTGSNFPTLTTAEKNKLGTLFWVVAIGLRRQVR